MNYESFRVYVERAASACDPVTFAYRQNSLLNAMAAYLLERDNPENKNDG